MSTFKLNISSPDGKIFQGSVAGIVVRGVEGELAVLAGHVPFITAVKAGKCDLRLEDGTLKQGRTEGGLLTVAKEEVTFLTSALEWA